MSTTTTRRVDSAWFAAAIKVSPFKTYRGLAAKMTSRDGGPMDVGPLWRLLHGKRVLRITEARQLADLLAQPLDEVLRRAGIDVRPADDDVEKRLRDAQRQVGVLLGVIDEHGVRLSQRMRDAAKRAMA